MPQTPQEMYDRVTAVAGPDGRLAVRDGIAGWEVFPFERDGLVIKPLDPPVEVEAPRHGEDPAHCTGCSRRDEGDWLDEHWRLTALEASGAPLVMVLMPRDHHDFADLPDDRAAEMGRIMVHLARAIEALPHVARAHVSKWGDGGAHAHVFFYARPEGFPQLRGTCMALWDDFLPPVPQDQVDADATAVVRALVASYGGTARR